MDVSILIMLAVFSLGLLVWGISTLSKIIKKAKEYDKSRPQINQLNIAKKELEQKEHNWEEKVKYDKSVLEYLADEKTKGFPWLLKAYDDYYKLRDDQLSDILKYKRHSALKSAEVVRQISKERREAEKSARLANYLLNYCRELAPWLDDYIGMEVSELDTIINEIHGAWEKKEAEFDEEVKRHFGPKYENLTPTEKLQKKLDWWWDKPNKTNWQIGRDYERYIGHLYENNGWAVNYHGVKGFEDLGRDLVCKNGKNVEVIQCKRWSQNKEIHEKHIYYLYATTVEYYMEHYPNIKSSQLSLFPDLIKKEHVAPKLITTANVSSRADQAAKILGVGIEQIPFIPYPSVKCNTSRRTGEKIFHLPFDQQYDTILIEEERLELYVKTVAEAEALGFRHAFRWKGEAETTINP